MKEDDERGEGKHENTFESISTLIIFRISFFFLCEIFTEQ